MIGLIVLIGFLVLITQLVAALTTISNNKYKNDIADKYKS